MGYGPEPAFVGRPCSLKFADHPYHPGASCWVPHTDPLEVHLLASWHRGREVRVVGSCQSFEFVVVAAVAIGCFCTFAAASFEEAAGEPCYPPFEGVAHPFAWVVEVERS